MIYKIKFIALSIQWWSSFLSSLQNIFIVTNFKDYIQQSTGKNSAKCNALNSSTCISNVIFADPRREGYEFHFLLGSVGKRAETNLNFPAPTLNHISRICKNLADTWPAATRVLSRGRKREDPGNKVAFPPVVGPLSWHHLLPQGRVFATLYDRSIQCWGINKGNIFLVFYHATMCLFSNRSQMTSKCGKNKWNSSCNPNACATDVLTTFWQVLWSITEQMHINMESTCFIITNNN